MNIDIATLLLGGTPGKPGKLGLLSDEKFSLALDDKLADLGLLFPDVDVDIQTLTASALSAAASPAVQTPVADDELPQNTLSLADMLTEESVDDESDDPQWQLQQLVTRSVTDAGAATIAARPDTGAAVSASAGDARQGRHSPAVNALAGAATAATTAAASSAAKPAPADAFTPTMASAVESSSAATVSAVALPAAVRTSAMPAPQQVVTVPHAPETPEWKQSVSQHIAVFSRNGLHNAEIRLNPEDLGSMHISLRLKQDQAQIHIVTEHAHVRQAMEQAMPQLRAAMAESGIQLGQANVSAESHSSAAGERGERAPGEEHNQADNPENATEEEMLPAVIVNTQGNIYGINTFA